MKKTVKTSDLLQLIEIKRRLDVAIGRLEGHLDAFWSTT